MFCFDVKASDMLSELDIIKWPRRKMVQGTDHQLTRFFHGERGASIHQGAQVVTVVWRDAEMQTLRAIGVS